MVDLTGRAKRVRVYLTETDKVRHAPASLAILELLRREHAQGATVLRAVAGFGSTGELHSYRLVDVVQHLPEIVEWVDAPDVVERLLPRLKELVPRGLVTVEDTEIVLHRPGPIRELPRSLTAADVMSRDVSSVPRDAPLRAVVELLLGKPYRGVPVVDGRVPVGIVTGGDLVRRGGLGVRVELLRALDRPELHDLLQRLAATGRTAGDVMTSRPTTVHAGTPLPAVAEVMSGRRLKRLPVVDDDCALVGMVSRVDLLRAASGIPAQGDEPSAAASGFRADAPVASVVRRDVPVVHADTPLPEVLQAVVSTRLNRAMVVDGERRVVGVVSDAELLDRVTPSLRPSALRSLVGRLPFARPGPEEALAEQHARGRCAEDLMERQVETVREDARVSDAIAAMLERNAKVVAVLDAEARLVGIVDRADLLHGLVAGG